MSDWIEVCRIDDIPARGARVVARGGSTPIAIFRTANDGVFALLDRCPHRGGPLSQGLVTGARVVCPLHGWTIGLADGQATAPDEGCAQSFDVDVQGGCVRLRRQDLVAPAQAGTPCLEEALADATGFPRSR
jgi:nitrite reductase (NADH) small subunit